METRNAPIDPPCGGAPAAARPSDLPGLRRGPRTTTDGRVSACCCSGAICNRCGARARRPTTVYCDPPICEECDAEINIAAIEEVELTDD
jgi:hypothetical protein